MVRVMLASPIVVLLLLFPTSFGWSEKSSIPLTTDIDSSTPSDSIQLEPSESKSKYKWRQGEEGRYILEEDSDNHKEEGPHKDLEQKYEEDHKENKKPSDQSRTKLESLKPKLKSPIVYKRREKEDGRQKDNNGRVIYHKEKKKTIPLETSSGSKGKASGYIERHDEDRYVKEKKYYDDGQDDEYDDEDEAYDKEKRIVAKLEPSESKWKKSKYKGRHGEGRYIMDEHDDYGKGGHGGKDGEFIEEAGNEEYNEEHSDRGYHNEDKKLDDETSKDYSIKGEDHEFKEGGASFDKHHKDIASENKENEHVNEHDEGEKFGAEALKEHKLGKHREKSVGHKKHGFKNVYHKEEYGDHKTFHDEFLDNDHHHEYDDQHENRKLEGGRFSKGYLKEGENKEKDAGDEKHAWGKGGFDSKHEGNYEEGGHITGHKQGHRKREGHHDANGHKHKHAKHKVKKGKVPEYHEEEHDPEYYARNQNPKKPVNSAGGSQYYGKDPAEPYDGGDLGYPPVTRTHARLPETSEDLDEPLRPGPAPMVDHRGAASKPLQPPEHHSFYYRNPQPEPYDQAPLREERYSPRVPQVPDVGPHNHRIVQHSPSHNPGVFPTQSHDPISHNKNLHTHQHPNHGNHHYRHNHHDPKNQPQQHFVVSQPTREADFQNHPHHSSVSKPYPWWKHSRRHGDPAQASSHHTFGHERAPHQQQNIWVPQSKYRYSEPYENRATQQHYGYARRPEYNNRHHPY